MSCTYGKLVVDVLIVIDTSTGHSKDGEISGAGSPEGSDTGNPKYASSLWLKRPARRSR